MPWVLASGLANIFNGVDVFIRNSVSCVGLRWSDKEFGCRGDSLEAFTCVPLFCSYTV
jgi:hypothetical protein